MKSPQLISFYDALQLHFILGSHSALLFHCSHVTNVAYQIINQLPSDLVLNKELILIGAMLHDIGRNRTQSIRHGFESYNIIKEFFPPSDFIDQVATLTSRHIGGGIPKVEAKELGLPDIDFLPISLEEKIVCYADKMVDYKYDKSKGVYQVINWFTFNSVENETKKLASHLGMNHPAISRLKLLETDILSFNNNKHFTFKDFSVSTIDHPDSK